MSEAENGHKQSQAIQQSRFVKTVQSAQLPVTGKGIASMSRLDALVLNYMSEKKIPGAALAITRSGRLVYARGFGYADLEAKEAVEPNYLFRIGGISQAITQAT